MQYQTLLVNVSLWHLRNQQKRVSINYVFTETRVNILDCKQLAMTCTSDSTTLPKYELVTRHEQVIQFQLMSINHSATTLPHMSSVFKELFLAAGLNCPSEEFTAMTNELCDLSRAFCQAPVLEA